MLELIRYYLDVHRGVVTFSPPQGAGTYAPIQILSFQTKYISLRVAVEVHE